MAGPDAASVLLLKASLTPQGCVFREHPKQCNIFSSAGTEGEAFPGLEGDGGHAFRADGKAKASKPSLRHCLDDCPPHSASY